MLFDRILSEEVEEVEESECVLSAAAPEVFRLAKEACQAKPTGCGPGEEAPPGKERGKPKSSTSLGRC